MTVIDVNDGNDMMYDAYVTNSDCGSEVLYSDAKLSVHLYITQKIRVLHAELQIYTLCRHEKSDVTQKL